MQVIKRDATLPLPLTIAQLSSTINIINPNDDQPSVPAPAPTSASLVIALNAIQYGQCLSPTLNTPPNLQLFQSHNRHWNFGSISTRPDGGSTLQTPVKCFIKHSVALLFFAEQITNARNPPQSVEGTNKALPHLTPLSSPVVLCKVIGHSKWTSARYIQLTRSIVERQKKSSDQSQICGWTNKPRVQRKYYLWCVVPAYISPSSGRMLDKDSSAPHLLLSLSKCIPLPTIRPFIPLKKTPEPSRFVSLPFSDHHGVWTLAPIHQRKKRRRNVWGCHWQPNGWTRLHSFVKFSSKCLLCSSHNQQK